MLFFRRRAKILEIGLADDADTDDDGGIDVDDDVDVNDNDDNVGRKRKNLFEA